MLGSPECRKPKTSPVPAKHSSGIARRPYSVCEGRGYIIAGKVSSDSNGARSSSAISPIFCAADLVDGSEDNYEVS